MWLSERDRCYIGLIWLAMCAYVADWADLNFMVGAFLAAAVMDSEWFDQKQMDMLRRNLLLIMMPVYFLRAKLRTDWSVGGAAVFIEAGVLLLAAVAGKLLAAHIAGKIPGWASGEAGTFGWLLQTKSLMMIILPTFWSTRASSPARPAPCCYSWPLSAPC